MPSYSGNGRAEGQVKVLSQAWIAIAFTSKSCFSIMLGNAATRLHKNAGGVGEPEEALQYFTLSITELSKQLVDPSPAERMSEGVVGAISGLACQEVLFGNMARGKMHLEALKRVVDMRGGIESLNNNYPLVLFIFWLDVIGALSWDEPPVYAAPWHVVRPACRLPLIATPSVQRDRIAAAWSRICLDDDLVRLTLESLARLSQWIDEEYPKVGKSLWQDQLRYTANFLPIAWTILSLPRLSTLARAEKKKKKKKSGTEPSSASPFDIAHFSSRNAAPGETVAVISEAVRIAAIVYLYTVNRNFDIPPDQSLPHEEKLFSLLRQPVAWEGAMGVLHLWCLVLSAFAQQDPGIREWHRVEIQTQMGELGLETREDLSKALKQVAWLDEHFEDRLNTVYSVPNVGLA
jgi:hypothetical protein